jgi:SAM-dependent methyltransferase
MADNYIINGGKSGAERLKVLFETLLPGTKELFKKAALESAEMILDMGCGGGDITGELSRINPKAKINGFDCDPSIIEIARQRAVRLPNTEFKILDIAQNDIGLNLYDVIVSRFLLSHLKSPENALSKFIEGLKSGGKVIVEDVDFDGHFCYPECSAFDKYVEFYTHLSKKRGMDPYIGRKLLLMVKNAGFDLQEFEIVNPAFNSGQGKSMGILTLRNIAQSILDDNLASEYELTSIINELDLFTKNEDSLISMPRIVRIIGVKK